MNLDLADREDATEPDALDPPVPADETGGSQEEPPLADFWSIEGSESGA